jgi:SAM-dependent methyltransferase
MNPGPSTRLLLNLGCGHRYHSDWTNIDIVAHGPGVVAHDLSRGIPLPDGSCDVVYHSHVVEHIRRAEALAFVRECFRVLKPGGVVRVATPDLERIAQLYLQKLNEASGGDAASTADYDWMLLEMYDQTVRERTGGEMTDFLAQNPLSNERFVVERIGQEGREIIAACRQRSGEPRRSVGREMIRRPRGLFEKAGAGLLKLFFGTDAPGALALGRFRRAGEVHQWMYDRFSLARLLKAGGFSEPTVRAATESAIPDWRTFNLDTLPDGSVVKPDSLFMEAVKAN